MKGSPGTRNTVFPVFVVCSMVWPFSSSMVWRVMSWIFFVT
jgi:hypothetical protein